MSDVNLQADENRRAMGFLTAAETLRLGEAGVRILDAHSTLVSAGVVLGPGAVLYPGVLVEKDADSSVVIGAETRLYPGTVVLASGGGSVAVGAGCQFGPGGVQVKANAAGAQIRIGNGVRLLNGCEVVGASEIGDGGQLIGAIAAQSVRLAGGLGGWEWPDPDERGAVVKGAGLARGLQLEMGQVVNLQPSFADAAVEDQRAYHPGASRGARG
jgi:carbonic anhydrase/acetyltransferase-like protein (isoleucine patch superfamily)